MFTVNWNVLDKRPLNCCGYLIYSVQQCHAIKYHNCLYSVIALL